MHVGQRIAIDVLNRHIQTSSGKCKDRDASLISNCVMADALRDRFPEANDVQVNTASATFNLPDGTYVWLGADEDMTNAIGAFDRVIDDVRAGLPLGDAIPELRDRIPRVVHATIGEIYATD